jgi:hypothetical protein
MAFTKDSKHLISLDDMSNVVGIQIVSISRKQQTKHLKSAERYLSGLYVTIKYLAIKYLVCRLFHFEY